MPIGEATCRTWDDQGLAVWTLRIGGQEVPGRWVIMDREFRPALKGQLERRSCRQCQRETWHVRDGLLAGPPRWQWVLLWLIALPFDLAIGPWRCLPCTRVRKPEPLNGLL
jgi:hypothetical protein